MHSGAPAGRSSHEDVANTRPEQSALDSRGQPADGFGGVLAVALGGAGVHLVQADEEARVGDVMDSDARRLRPVEGLGQWEDNDAGTRRERAGESDPCEGRGVTPLVSIALSDFRSILPV